MSAFYNEIEPFCCSVIRANIARGRLPEGVVCEKDVRELDPVEPMGHSQIHLFAGIAVAAYACRLAGMPDDFSIGTFGFPCQQISAAGRGEGIGTKENPTERSGLFYEAVRIFAVARPTWLLAENVAALRTRGAGNVVAELENIGYTVLDPIVVGADDIGAPHRRKRVWIVARVRERVARQVVGRGSDALCELGNTELHGRSAAAVAGSIATTVSDDACRSHFAFQFKGTNTTGELAAAQRWPSRPGQDQYDWEPPRTITDAEVESQMGGADDGDAKRLVRAGERHRKESLKALGNAWVPQTAVPILRWIFARATVTALGLGSGNE